MNAAPQYTTEQEEALQAVDEYEVRHNRKKAIAMSYRMGKAKDPKKHAHYIIQTIKKSIEASPGCLPTDEAELEPVADIPSKPKPAKPKGGPLARLAGIWCADSRFQRWSKTSDAKSAALFIYEICMVSSRAALDHDSEAARRFHSHIRRPFMVYLAK
jgi:hypothetical protein